MREIRGYLDLVIDEKLPLNHEILYHLQVYSSLFVFLFALASSCILLFAFLFHYYFLLVYGSHVFESVQLQDVFNLLPNLNVAELIKAFSGNIS